ncbi:MAG: phosphatidylserine/phosphatidylglycerophosphate/cardiolipin synthase family protein [Myxococcales bacterium]|nr:phosphatidylserine/phosphatidylglycerophosphate/cardiolipin synthase family protein [Myxococcales bacterium]
MPALAGPEGKPPPFVLEEDPGFSCSPLEPVGCSGVLPLRRSGPGAARSEVAVLPNGEDAFRARISTLRAAKRSVRIQALIFRADEAGLFVSELLKAKRKEGLEVRVIVDATSNLDWQTQWMYFDLKQHGIEVEGYEALYLEWVTADLKPNDPLRPNKRFHEKMWIVDGDSPEGVAIVGGLNIANEYFRIDQEPINRWRDQDVIVRGPLVKDVVAAFDRNVDYFKGLKARLGAVNPDNSWKLTRATLGRIAKVKVPSWRREALAKSVAAAADGELRLGFHPVTARFIQSRPREKESYIHQAYLQMVEAASSRILIANAYFVPSKALTQALRRAAERGVRVVVLTNSPETNDIVQVARVSRFTFLGLLEPPSSKGSVEIYEWVGPRLKEGTLHAKYAVFDGREAIVGSYNLDPRSERLNSETALALRDGAVAGELERILLEQDLSRAARVSLEQARSFRRPKDSKEQFELLYALPMRDWL